MLSALTKKLSLPAVCISIAVCFLASAKLSADDASLNLPDMGSTAGTVLSPGEERRLGDAFMRSVRQQLKLVEDPLVESYVKSLGNLLVGFSGHHPFDFSFFVVDDPRINAFAGPGGYIGVNAGLILAAESESEVASVVAHELAHVTQRHLVRSFEEANKLSLPTAAAVIAAIIVGAGNPQIAEALLAAGIAGNIQTQLNFSRLHEQEADRIGIETLYQAGFDPRAMPSFFERLQQASRYADGGAPEFLSTHPVTLSRIADSRGRAEKFQYRHFTDSVEYHLTRERLLFLANKKPPAQRAREVATNLKSGKYRNEFAARYAYVLALTANNEFEAARDQVSELLRRDRERVPYFAAQAQIEISAGKPARAKEILRHALSLYPHDTPLTLMLSATLIDSGEVQQARAMLVSQGRYEAGNPAYFELLAKSAERLRLPDEAHEAWADYYYLYGRLPLAMEHIRSALRQPDISFYSKSRLEARLKELQQELPAGPGNRSGGISAQSAYRKSASTSPGCAAMCIAAVSG